MTALFNIIRNALESGELNNVIDSLWMTANYSGW